MSRGRLVGSAARLSILLSLVASGVIAAPVQAQASDSGALPAALTPPTWREVDAPPNVPPASQWIEIDAPDGYRLLAAVFRPQGVGPFPVVVLLHPGGGLNSMFLALGPELASAGFVAVAGCWFVAEPANRTSRWSSSCTVGAGSVPPAGGVGLSSRRLDS